MSLSELWEMLTWPDRGGLIAVIIGLPAATYYPLMFGRVRFWESDIGKSMFLKGTALCLVFWLGIGSLAATMYSWGWYEWIRLPANWLLVAAVWYQVLVMHRVQKSGELEDRIKDKS